MFSAQEKQLVHFSEIGKVASGLIHDLSNIFMAVSVGAQELHALSHTDPKHRVLQKSIEKLLDSLQRANTYFLFAQKHIQLVGSKEVFCVSDELQKIYHLLHFKIKSKGIKYRHVCPKDIFIYGDCIKFYQVISNILSNAIDSCSLASTRPGRVRITVIPKKNTVVLLVEDNGVGISHEYQENIFIPFFTTKKEGVGIGLSVVKSIIEKEFLGTIGFYRNKKQGVTFKVVFPLHK